MYIRRQFFQKLALTPSVVLTISAVAAEAALPRKRVMAQTSPINGFQYYKGRQVLPSLRKGRRLTLRREPLNRYDERAVAVYRRKDKLGYLPRMENTAIAGMMDNGEMFECFAAEVLPQSYPWRAVYVRVDWVSA